MTGTHNYDKRPARNLLPHEFYFGGGAKNTIFNSISKNGNQLESKLGSLDESRVPRPSQKILSKREIEHIISSINSIRCVDLSDQKKINLEQTIQKRKEVYKSAPPKIMVRETGMDVMYAKCFDNTTGIASYKIKTEHQPKTL